MRFINQICEISAILLLASSTLVAATPQTETEYTVTNSCTRKTAVGDRIKVHYRGTLKDGGTEFDASYSRGEPLSFQVGKGQVIKGWDEGLLGMCIGDKRKLTIPPELAYGDRDMGPIPGKSTLIFETELMGIDGVDADNAGKEKEL